MTIQKKSLISNMKTTKKALIASNTPAASSVEPKIGLSKSTHNFSKATHNFSKATHNFSKATHNFSKAVK